MAFAISIFHWSPAEFWDSGPCELYPALEVYREINSDSRSSQEEDFAAFYEKCEKAGVI